MYDHYSNHLPTSLSPEPVDGLSLFNQLDHFVVVGHAVDGPCVGVAVVTTPGALLGV